MLGIVGSWRERACKLMLRRGARSAARRIDEVMHGARVATGAEHPSRTPHAGNPVQRRSHGRVRKTRCPRLAAGRASLRSGVDGVGRFATHDTSEYVAAACRSSPGQIPLAYDARCEIWPYRGDTGMTVYRRAAEFVETVEKEAVNEESAVPPRFPIRSARKGGSRGQTSSATSREARAA